MPTLTWDHTVHYVNDLQEAIDIFEANGLHAFLGGSHTKWGTYNSLSYFGLDYIEFLGVENEELARSIQEPNQVVKDSVKFLPEQEVLSRVAIRTDDIEAVVARLREHHIDVSPVMAGSRHNAQGQLIEWKMATIAGNFQGLDYPFVIQWGQNDDERLESLKEAGAVKDHPAGDVTVKAAVFEVENPVEAASHWREVFGLELESNEKEAKIQIGERQFIFQKGEANALKQLVFETNSPQLKGKTIKIGEGEYVF